MNITALVENTSHMGLETAHGLSFYIETQRHKLLFDLGPDETLFENSRRLGIDLAAVDTVIISHGHRDHGGALEQFLAVNSTAKVYLQKSAFLPHFSQRPQGPRFNGLDPALAQHPQLVLLEGDTRIDPQLQLFTVEEEGILRSPANDSLYEEQQPDRFLHEQNLLLQEGGNTVLICGCSHCGIVNILQKAETFAPRICIGGFHLCRPSTGESVDPAFLEQVAQQLKRWDVDYYTCHCTGQPAFEYLQQTLPRLSYFSGGMSLRV